MPPDWRPARGFSSPEARRLLDACEDVLDGAGVDAGACLRTSCPRAATCWPVSVPAPAAAVLPRLPWVGPAYRPGGAVVVGMNAQSHGGLLDEAHVIEATAAQLTSGRQRFFGGSPRGPSWFHYRAAVAAGLLVDALEGRTARIRDPQEAVQPLLRSARLQAVQCAPAGSPRRAPTREMWRQCPSHVAWPTLATLRPGAVALLGREVSAAFAGHHEVVWNSEEPLLRAGHAEVAGRTTLVFALRHPSSGFGMRSLQALERALDVPGITGAKLGDPPSAVR